MIWTMAQLFVLLKVAHGGRVSMSNALARRADVAMQRGFADEANAEFAALEASV